MGRIIVKSLPKHTSEEHIKNHFSKIGKITDVKLIKNKQGYSRRFCYIGFETGEVAEKAIEYFNNTFFDTSKIQVELARKMNDPNLPRAWSKYSKEKEQEGQNQAQKLEPKFEKENKSIIEQDNPLSLLNQVGEDPKLLEYLEAMKSRTKAKTWANDDSYMMKSTNTNDDSNVKVKLPVMDDDDEYQDLPLKSKSNENENDEGSDLDEEDENENDEEAQKDEIVHDEKVSDKDYLKSRMVTSGKSLLELTENDDIEIGNIDSKDKHDESKQDIEDESKQKAEEINQSVSNDQTNQETDHLPTYLSDEAKILDNGRLFLRNLAYTCTEDHLKDIFGQFGQLQEVHLPIDKFTKKPLGTAYIQFVLPSHALEAFKNLSGTSFLGRLLHVLPAQDKIEKDLTADAKNMSLKDKKALEKKLKADKDFNWNSLFMNQDAVAESIADRLGVSKKDVLDPESKNVAIRLALAETNIINETKQYLIDNGIDVTCFNKKERSDTVILVKNIPFGTTEDELRNLFGKHGELGRILIPPAQTIAVVEYLHPTEARSAFKYLAYRRFGDAPIYLEKAPINVFRADAPTNKMTNPISEPKLDPKSQVADQVMSTQTNAEDLETSTIFVKNLNFDTTVANLRKVFEPVGDVKSATIKTKPDPKRPGRTLSLGFGFVDFSSRESALKALQTLQGFNLDGHSLVLKQGKTDLSKSVTSKQEKSLKGTKLIVKNIPFEATKNEIKELFGTFGQLKSVRLPTKFSGGHRGFAFLEFTTAQEAKNVLDQVSNTHLYGRHLVLNWAQEDEGVDDLRKKTSRLFDKVKDGESNKNKKRRIDMEEGDDKMNEDEEF